MTTRPLNAILNGNEVSVDYVDFLCVHKSHRKKGLAQKIIYSHYFNSRKDRAGPVFLFKREGVINFIVPLTVYTAYVFPLKNLKHPNLELPNNIICHLINDSNFSLFAHFFEDIKNHFKSFITPELAHIKHLVSKAHYSKMEKQCNWEFDDFDIAVFGSKEGIAGQENKTELQDTIKSVLN